MPENCKMLDESVVPCALSISPCAALPLRPANDGGKKNPRQPAGISDVIFQENITSPLRLPIEKRCVADSYSR